MRFICSHLLILLCIFALSIPSVASANEDAIVTEHEIEEYTQTYLKTYWELLEDNIASDYWEQFDLYERYPYHIIATISTDHGAALQFIPSETESFEIEKVSEKIEQAVFNNEYAISIENSSILMKKTTVNNVSYDYPILLKGSNREEYWTAEVAVDDALFHFETDIPNALLTSEEFKKYLAYPELEKLAQEMIDKLYAEEYSSAYGLLKFNEEYEKLYNTGNKYGVSSEFCDEVYNFLEKQKAIEQQKATEQKIKEVEQEIKELEPKWFEHPIFITIISIIGGAVLTWAIVRKKSTKRKDKGTKSSIQRAKRKRKPKTKRKKR